ncbi:MAG TPA: phage holin family protein [Longimicrobiaceae bacterium]|nr:phage holin family protein [Longimicrobiaceae bacterium]
MPDDIHVTRTTTTTRTTEGPVPGAEPSLGDLFKQLAQDSATLVKQEVTLAKAEMRENLRTATKDAVMIAVGGGLLLVGLLVLTAFLVAALGDLLDNYWLGALIVGVLFVAVGGILAKKYMGNLKNDDLGPDQTIQTLKEDKRWLQSEIQQAKKELA